MMMTMRSERQQSGRQQPSAGGEKAENTIRKAGSSFALVFFTAASRIMRIREFYTAVENWALTPLKTLKIENILKINQD